MNTKKRLWVLTPSALAAGLVIQSLALAQAPHSIGSSYSGESTLPLLGTAPHAFAGTSNGGVDYRLNVPVVRLVVEVEKNDLPSDGVTANRITIRALDVNGQLVANATGKLFATIEVSGGRILLDGAKTDEFGSGRRDADTTVPGTQVELQNGLVSFSLLAPLQAQDVRVRVTMGSAVAQGVVTYLPELREMLATGLIEGIVVGRRQTGTSTGRINDSFEKELQRWVQQSDDGRRSFGVRSAFFVKGQLQNDWLLTAAFDSDKDVSSRLFKDPRSDDSYPAYGDSALRGSEAKSADRAYLRLDRGKSFGLYGDFNTGDGFSQLSGSGSTAGMTVRNLGAYSRSATGLKGHVEQQNYIGNGYYFRDDLKQVVEEYRGNGTSGPYFVGSRSGVQGTEKVEIITRDRNQLGVVVDVLPLVRFDDYTFEPFSGAILLKSPAPALTSNGNPRYLRITYEVEQGGQRFAAYGVDGQLRIASNFEVGGSLNRDENPLSPYTLMSANTSVKLGDGTRLVAEVARAKSTRYQTGSSTTTTPSGGVGEQRNDRTGDAVRIEVQHKQGDMQASMWALKSDVDFYNPSASIGEGKSEIGSKIAYKVDDDKQVYGELSRTKQKSVVDDPTRDAVALGFKWKPAPMLAVDLSLRHTQEERNFGGNSTLSSIPTGGGFYGLGVDATNPVSGIANVVPAAGAVNAVDRKATSVRLGAQLTPAERWGLSGEVELGSEDQRRFSLGLQYQLAERARAFARYENQRGLTSAASLNPADKSNAFSLGVESSYMQGGTLFSEYRLLDAVSAEVAANRDMQLATGVRNTWNVAEGLAYTTSAEVLKVFQGGVRNALALGGGVDYRVNDLTQFSGRLEWRRVYDDVRAIGDQTENQYLSTISLARKMDRDWTVLARNYALVNSYYNGERIQDRFQIGAAWRPVDHNRFNALGRYEYKTQRDTRMIAAPEDSYQAHIVSIHGAYHPTRASWVSGRAAYKNSISSFTNPDGSVVKDGFSAVLLGGRVTYDLTENWDVSYMASVMQGLKGDKSRQFASGVEVGYLLRQDLWLSAGINWAGFSDRDLTSGEYTSRGVFLRLRYKFDENLFRSDNTRVTRTLER